MTIYFQSHEITIRRRRRVSGTNRFALSATYTAYNADIQPASDERQLLDTGRYGAVYTAFVDEGVDIKENDQVVSGGKTYSVRGVQTYTGASLLSHKELVLVAEDG